MRDQSIGPVIGGIISQYLGFHAIFWFLFGLGALTLFLIQLLLPETLRSIAGNGSIRLKSIHRPFIYYYKQPADALLNRGPQEKSRFLALSHHSNFCLRRTSLSLSSLAPLYIPSGAWLLLAQRHCFKAHSISINYKSG
jgi:MFS family permease